MYGAWVAADDEQSIRCTVNLTRGDGDFGDFGPTLSSLDLNKGWWRPTKYTFKDSPVTQDGLRWCRYGTNACRGGTEFYGGGQSYCEPGHKGPLCAVCDEGWSWSIEGLRCVRCENHDTVRLVAMLVMQLLMGIQVRAQGCMTTRVVGVDHELSLPPRVLSMCGGSLWRHRF